MNQQAIPAALVIGANSSIARAIIQRILTTNPSSRIVAVSRSVDTTEVEKWQGRLLWIQSDYSESSMAKIASRVQQEALHFDRIFLCNGILHDQDVFPEKRMEELDAGALQKVMHVNAFVPILWLKNLKPLLRGKQRQVVTTFSARVGSIEDNQRGGWYSYRASKAALNMMLKSAAIEICRSSPGTSFLAFHPGTTDTPLSKPFHKNVPSNNLFSPDFVAAQLLSIIESLPADSMNFLDWKGRAIAW